MTSIPELVPLTLAGGLHDPCGLAFDADGSLWIGERGGTLRRLSQGEPTISQFRIEGSPRSILVDAYGRVLYSDAGSHSIRRFDPQSGQDVVLIDRHSDETLCDPSSLCFDGAGNLLFSCRDGNVWCVRADGDAEIIANELQEPDALCMIGESLLLIAELGEKRVWTGTWDCAERIWIDEFVWACHLGKSARPQSISRGADGRVYICLPEDGQIVALNHDGLIAETIFTGHLRPHFGAFDPAGTLGFVFGDPASGQLHHIPALGPGIAMFNGGATWPL